MTAKERIQGDSGTGAPTGEPGFEESLQRIEAIVKTLEGGELPLEETLRLFEEGQVLLRTCGDLLGRAELRVQELLRQADGSLELREAEGLSAGPEGEEGEEGPRGPRSAAEDGTR